MVNVYKVLGVPATATDGEIKKAYKALSKQFHPDRGGDPERMTEINEAYGLIDTPEKRKKYDAEHAFSTEFRQWETIFGKSNVARDFGKAPTGNSSAKRGKDIDLTLNIPLQSFVNGQRVVVAPYERTCECQECGGVGILSTYHCPVCGGTGQVRSIDPAHPPVDRVHKCPKCDGERVVPKEKCSACQGKGTYTKHSTHTFTYKPGQLDLNVPGKGCEGTGGGENGTLRIHFVPEDEHISYADGKFYVDIGLHPEDFILGTTVDLDFGGKMVVYRLEPGNEYDARRVMDDVAGTKCPLEMHFYVAAESDAPPNDNMVAAAGAMRQARN